MYDKHYAEAWIADYESGKDVHRSRYIMPFLKKVLSEAPERTKILDVGCGWGIAIPYIKKSNEYIGIDVTTDFFEYVKKLYPYPNVALQYGGLPDVIGLEGQLFDLIICSMSLHTVNDLELSIKNLFAKLRPSGKLILIDFNNDAEKFLQKRFRGLIQEGHCKGMYTLDCGLEVESEIFFHREEDYKRELSKYGSPIKTELGPVFVGYELTK